MDEKASSEHVDLATYADGKIEVDISLAQYEILNNVALSSEGKSLSELSEEDPILAYNLIRRMVGSLAAGTNYVTINEKVIVEKDHDGQDATNNVGQFTLMNRMPASYERAIKFSLGIYPSKEDRILFGDLNDPGSRISVLDLDIEPPSYA